MIRKNKNKQEELISTPNHTHNNMLTGMFLGFLMYIAFDMYRDDKRRKKLVKDLQNFQQEITPYVLELKQYIETNNDVKNAVKAIDQSLGTNLYSFIVNAKSTSKASNEGKTKSATTSIRRFFKVK